MRIGIDIDDVITDTSASMKEYIIRYDTNGELAKNIEDIMRGDASTPFIEKFFIDHFLDIAGNAKIKDNAVRVIKKLFDNGNEIYLINLLKAPFPCISLCKLFFISRLFIVSIKSTII